MKRLLIAGALVLGLALVGAPAHAQTGTARGKVVDDKGQPIPEAKVVLEFTGGVTRKYETKTGKLDEAEAAHKELVAKQPSIPEIYHNLGYIYGQRKDWAKAEEAYKKALELRPIYPDAATGLARVYQESGQSDKAMELMS